MHALLLASVNLHAYAPVLPVRAPTPLAWLDAPLLPSTAAASTSGVAARVAGLQMAVMEPPPKVRSSAVTRRHGGQLISWYFNSISSTRLLSAEQERQLSTMIIAGDEYERMRDELEEQLGRKPRMEEWAAEAQLEPRELRKRMRRANSARDLMVAANSARHRQAIYPIDPSSERSACGSSRPLSDAASLSCVRAAQCG